MIGIVKTAASQQGHRCAGRPRYRSPCHAPDDGARHNHDNPLRLLFTHSFIWQLREGHCSRAGSQGPRPSPGTPSAARRGPEPPPFPGRCRPHSATARSGHPDPGLGPTRAPTPPALPAAGPPASAPLRSLRPPGSCGEGGARPRRSPLGVQDPSARATPGPEGLRGWVGPTGHSPPPGQNRGACSKPFETAWAAAHPAVSSLFIGPRRTAHRAFIGPFERTVCTRRPQL